QGSKRGSWKTMPSLPDNGRSTVPLKSVSSLAMMRSIVVLPQPDGPTRAPTSLFPMLKQTSRRTSKRSPDAVVNALCAMRTSSCTNSPAGRTSFNGLHDSEFDTDNNNDECQRITEEKRHVKHRDSDAEC